MPGIRRVRGSTRDLFENRRFVGELAGFELAVDQLIVDKDLESAVPEGAQGDPVHVFLEGRGNLVRQTDGMRLIVSL